jgi:hypothetical protein
MTISSKRKKKNRVSSALDNNNQGTTASCIINASRTYIISTGIAIRVKAARAFISKYPSEESSNESIHIASQHSHEV